MRRFITLVSLVILGCATSEEDLGPGGDGGGIGGGAGTSSGGGGISSGGGGVSSGGGGISSGGTGGFSATGGTTDGGVGDAANCKSGEKSCSGTCIAPSPGVGCSLTDCKPCSVVLNANAKCTGTACDFDCISGYVKNGNKCDPSGGGGVGAGGSGGFGLIPIGGSGGGGATDGGSGCPAPCDPSSPTSILTCTIFCGSPGICLPGANCCQC